MLGLDRCPVTQFSAVAPPSQLSASGNIQVPLSHPTADSHPHKLALIGANVTEEIDCQEAESYAGLVEVSLSPTVSPTYVWFDRGNASEVCSIVNQQDTWVNVSPNLG